MASSVLPGVGPSHGLYASFAAPIVGGPTSSTRLTVITTTSAAALAAGSTLAEVDAEDRLVEDVVPTELKPYDVVVIDVRVVVSSPAPAPSSAASRRRSRPSVRQTPSAGRW